ncbi:hypothetical protein OHAE_5235 [Ochrobactrum soli]|uniref:Uncharacterized protein n=1 Tax=Ochrobactrum soli TaxID=2448455 RepID=A0A2P9HEV1_9HYPH|nr:hypothetical protein OHAE_5235 [[Ochrobactrum] soli]
MLGKQQRMTLVFAKLVAQLGDDLEFQLTVTRQAAQQCA